MTKLNRSDRIRTTGAQRGRSRPRRVFVGIAALASALALFAGGPTGTAVGDETSEDNNADSEAAVAAEAPLNYTPITRTSFNNPQGSRAAQETLITWLNRAIDGTAGGQTIKIASYLFDMGSTADKLIAAHKRGVNVQMLIDDGERSAELGKVRTALGTDRSKRSFVTTCQSGCHQPSPSIIHAKIFLISRVGDAKWVSIVGSANPWYHNVYNSWNNQQQIVNDRTIFYSLNRYFHDMLADQNRDAYRTTSSGRYKLYFFPKTSGDPMILEVLRNISCTGVASGYGSGGRTVIRIAMWGWAAAREDIALRLNVLHQRGCKIEVLLNKDRTSKTVFAALLKPSSKYGKIRIYDGWYDGNDNGVAGLYIHHKALIISGNWFGHPDTKVVYSGSQNYTYEGLRKNNEVVLRVKNNAVYNAYHSNFNYIRDNWTKGIITEVPSFVGEKNVADLRTLGEGLEQEEQIEALIDPRVGWYVPPGQDVDNDR